MTSDVSSASVVPSGRVSTIPLTAWSPVSSVGVSRKRITIGCYVVPAFSGLLAPHWEGEARGIVGQPYSPELAERARRTAGAREQVDSGQP